MKYILPAALASAMIALTACSSDDDGDNDGDNGGGTPPTEAAAPSEPGSFQVTLTNMTAGQLMTPPVLAIHSPTVHIFEIGGISSDPVRDIAETGNNAALVEFAGANTDVISAAGVAGDGPFGAGTSVTLNLETTEAGQVFSAISMLVCTNDGITGLDSIALPADNNPVTFMTLPYDAGTRMNQPDALSFFPPPCAAGDAVNEAPLEDPRAPIGAHAGQSGLANVPEGANWDFATGDNVMMIEIVRL